MNQITHAYKQGSDLHPELFRELVSFIELKTNSPIPGTVYNVPVDDLISDDEYNAIDASILNLFNKGLLITMLGILFSDYYKIQRVKRKKTFQKTLRYICKYYLVFRSLKNKNYTVPNVHLKSFPWIFISKDLKLRLDGHHRSAIFKFLGKPFIPARVITPNTLTAYSLPDSLKGLLKNHLEPEISFEVYPLNKMPSL